MLALQVHGGDGIQRDVRRPPHQDQPHRTHLPVGDAVVAAAVLHQPQVAARHNSRSRLGAVLRYARLGSHRLPRRRARYAAARGSHPQVQHRQLFISHQPGTDASDNDM